MQQINENFIRKYILTKFFFVNIYVSAYGFFKYFPSYLFNRYKYLKMNINTFIHIHTHTHTSKITRTHNNFKYVAQNKDTNFSFLIPIYLECYLHVMLTRKKVIRKLLVNRITDKMTDKMTVRVKYAYGKNVIQTLCL